MAAAEAIHLKRPKKAHPSQGWAIIGTNWQWPARAQSFDKYQALREAAIIQSDRDRALAAHEGAIADEGELYRDFIRHAAAHGPEMAMKIMTRLIRSGQSAHMLEAHKTLFGVKTEVNSTSKEWKVLSFKKLE